MSRRGSISSRQSSRQSKKPRLFGVVAHPDLSGLRRGVVYGSGHHNQAQYHSTDLHDVGYSAAPDSEKRGFEVYKTVLKKAGWRHFKSCQLDSSFCFVAHPFSKDTAEEGVTMFCSYEAIGRQVEKDGGDSSMILERAELAGATVPSHLMTKPAAGGDGEVQGEEEEENNAAMEMNRTVVTPTEQARRQQQPQEPTDDRAAAEQHPGLAQGVAAAHAEEAEVDLTLQEGLENWLEQKLGRNVPAKIRARYAQNMVECGFDSSDLLEEVLEDEEEGPLILKSEVKMFTHHVNMLMKGKKNS